MGRTWEQAVPGSCNFGASPGEIADLNWRRSFYGKARFSWNVENYLQQSTFVSERVNSPRKTTVQILFSRQI
jgi:hypothetical protein